MTKRYVIETYFRENKPKMSFFYKKNNRELTWYQHLVLYLFMPKYAREQISVCEKILALKIKNLR